MNNPAHQRLDRYRAVHQPDAGAGSVEVEGEVRPGGTGRRARTEQVTEGEVVEEEILDFADVVVDFGNGALDFLVRVTGIDEGV